jgi:hypothetical protein
VKQNRQPKERQFQCIDLNASLDILSTAWQKVMNAARNVEEMLKLVVGVLNKRVVDPIHVRAYSLPNIQDHLSELFDFGLRNIFKARQIVEFLEKPILANEFAVNGHLGSTRAG